MHTRNGPWPWWAGGLVLGAVFLAAVALVTPIGVSTQFVVVDGIVWSWFDQDLVSTSPEGVTTSSNAYLASGGGKMARDIAQPWSYGLLFVLAMLGGPRPSAAARSAPPVWRARFGNSPWPRHLATFGAGVLVLFGARLAGGCTSGHMMSGMMQTALSGYLFAAAAFATAIPLAILLFRSKSGEGA